MSKGSTPRPFSVSDQEYAARLDMIFQRDLPEPYAHLQNIPGLRVDPVTGDLGIGTIETDPATIRAIFEKDDE